MVVNVRFRACCATDAPGRQRPLSRSFCVLLDPPRARGVPLTVADQHRADDAATRLRGLQRAIEAGAEPEALVDEINRAKEERDTALIGLDRVPVTRASSRAEVDALIDHLSVTGEVCGMPSRRTCNGSTGNCGST
jgi:hypothetical protein